MPKFTETGKEVGSSECPAIVLGKTAYTTNQKVLENHRATIAGVEKLNMGNRLKRVLAKFEAIRSHPRGVNGRSKLSLFLHRRIFAPEIVVRHHENLLMKFLGLLT